MSNRPRSGAGFDRITDLYLVIALAAVAWITVSLLATGASFKTSVNDGGQCVRCDRVGLVEGFKQWLGREPSLPIYVRTDRITVGRR